MHQHSLNFGLSQGQQQERQQRLPPVAGRPPLMPSSISSGGGVVSPPLLSLSYPMSSSSSSAALMASNPLMFNPAVGRPKLHLSSSTSLSSSFVGSNTDHPSNQMKEEGENQQQLLPRRPLGNMTNNNTLLPAAAAASMEWKQHNKQHLSSMHKHQGSLLGYSSSSSLVPSSLPHPQRLQHDPSLALGKLKARFDPFGSPPLIPHFDQQQQQQQQQQQPLQPQPQQQQQGVSSNTASSARSSSSFALVPSSTLSSSMLYGEGAPTPDTEDHVTRHLCIGNIKSENDARAIMRIVESSGDIKASYRNLLQPSGILMVTMYDLREAAVAFEALKSFFSSEYQEGVQVTYISDARLAQISNTPLQDSRSASMVIISLYGPHDRLMGFNYKEFFDIWGTTRNMVEMESSGIRRTFQVEYFDQRASSGVAADLRNQVYQGITFMACSAWRSDAVIGGSSGGGGGGTAFTSPDTTGLFDSPTSRLSSSPSSGYFTFTSGVAATATAAAAHQQQASTNEQLALMIAEHRHHHTHHPSSVHPPLFRMYNPEQQQHLRATSASLPSPLMGTIPIPTSTGVDLTPSASSFSYFSSTNGQPSRSAATEEEHQYQHSVHGGGGSASEHDGSGDSSTSDHHAEAMSTTKEIVGGGGWQQEYHHRTLVTHARGTASVSASSSSQSLHHRLPSSITTSTRHQQQQHQQRDVSVKPQLHSTVDNAFNVERVLDGSEKRTTFMIRNIPNKYTQQMLKECIDATHRGTYDFLYLRIDFQNRCNVGYAFINFIDVNSVISFAQERVGKRWNRFNSEKRCSISYANIQGKEALIEKFRNSTVMEEEESYRPKIFYTSGPRAGEEQPFPPPTIPLEVRRQRQEQRWSRETTG